MEHHTIKTCGEVGVQLRYSYPRHQIKVSGHLFDTRLVGLHSWSRGWRIDGKIFATLRIEPLPSSPSLYRLRYSCFILHLLQIVTIYAFGHFHQFGLAGWPKTQSSSPGRIKNCLFCLSSRQTLGPTQPPIQWVPGSFSLGSKAAGAWSWSLPPTSAGVNKTWN
jgi:hypothetical protein